MTNDVETTSIVNNCLSRETGRRVFREAMPELLEIYAEFNVKCTFFFNGDIVQEFPDVVKMVVPGGHEVASHGLVHDVDQAFDVLSFDEQLRHLSLSREILEEIAGKKVISFRAPALRVNQDTPRALVEAGFLIDSSVASQRMDMFFSFGSRRKLKWLRAPRGIYRTDEADLTRRGEGSIVEVPVSTMGVPYIGTVMRIAPMMTRIVRWALKEESLATGRPVVFLFHPNELLAEDLIEGGFNRRTTSFFSYLIADFLRARLKRRNLGKLAGKLLREQLRYWKVQGYEFITVRECVEGLGMLDNAGECGSEKK